MKIYVAHATSFDYKNELYHPLKSSDFWGQHTFFLPHDHQENAINTKNIILNRDLFIAEVSYPSIGLGIELGWASVSLCKIVCLAKEGATLSSALNVICSDIVAYATTDTMIQIIASRVA